MTMEYEGNICHIQSFIHSKTTGHLILVTRHSFNIWDVLSDIKFLFFWSLCSSRGCD